MTHVVAMLGLGALVFNLAANVLVCKATTHHQVSCSITGGGLLLWIGLPTIFAVTLAFYVFGATRANRSV